MGNWGMKCSRDGIDVGSGNDRDMIFTSKYANLKGSLSGSGSKVVPNSGVKQTVTIPHGLSYIPMVQGYHSSDNVDFGILPYFNLLGTLQIKFNIKADSTNVYLEFTMAELVDPPANYTIYYKYFIFIDKGKL